MIRTMNSVPHWGKPVGKSAVFLFLTLVLALAPASGSASGPANLPPPPGDYRPGVVLVKLKPLVATRSAASVLAAEGLVALEEIPTLGVQVVAVSPGQELATAEQLRQNPLVEYAEPDYVVYGLGTADDEYYSEQWNLLRIQADRAWDITTPRMTTATVRRWRAWPPPPPTIASVSLASRGEQRSCPSRC